MTGTLRLIAVIGAPASGKSTLSRHLHDTTGATVVRLREFAAAYRQQHPAQAEAFATTDPLGWLPNTTVAMLLTTAIQAPPLGRAPVVVLENLPGNATQLTFLQHRTAALGARLDLVVLTAPDDVLTHRARHRRVCTTCEPDPHGDPHRPAYPTPEDPHRCRQCDGRLTARRCDEPALQRARRRRFRQYLPAIRAAALAAYVPCHVLDSTGDVTTTATALQTACRLTPLPIR